MVRRICVGYSGDTPDEGDWAATWVKRLGLSQRAWYSIAGSKDTREETNGPLDVLLPGVREGYSD